MKCIVSFFAIILFSISSRGSSSPALDTSTVEHHRGVRGILEKRVKRQIYSGTEFCGTEVEAQHEEDFSPKSETDMCCHFHDKCEHHILSREAKYGLKNNRVFKVFECQCDLEFSKCLEQSSEGMSERVDRLYRNLLAAPCFYFDEDGTAMWNEKIVKKSKSLLYQSEAQEQQIWEGQAQQVWDDVKKTGQSLWDSFSDFIDF